MGKGKGCIKHKQNYFHLKNPRPPPLDLLTALITYSGIPVCPCEGVQPRGADGVEPQRSQVPGGVERQQFSRRGAVGHRFEPMGCANGKSAGETEPISDGGVASSDVNVKKKANTANKEYVDAKGPEMKEIFADADTAGSPPAERRLSVRYSARDQSSGRTSSRRNSRGSAPFDRSRIGVHTKHGLRPGPRGQSAAKINQDRGVVCWPYNNSFNQALLCIFDGHGRNGEKVSEYCTTTVPEARPRPAAHTHARARASHRYMRASRRCVRACLPTPRPRASAPMIAPSSSHDHHHHHHHCHRHRHRHHHCHCHRHRHRHRHRSCSRRTTTCCSATRPSASRPTSCAPTSCSSPRSSEPRRATAARPPPSSTCEAATAGAPLRAALHTPPCACAPWLYTGVYLRAVCMLCCTAQHTHI